MNIVILIVSMKNEVNIAKNRRFAPTALDGVDGWCW